MNKICWRKLLDPTRPE